MISDLWNCCKIGHQKNRCIASSFFKILFKKKLWKNFLDDPTFSSSLNATPRSAINFTTETKRCRRMRFPILFALIDLTGWLCINSSWWLVTSATICNRGIYSICFIDCLWLLRRSRACFQSKIPFLIRKCAHFAVSAHISLQVKQ